jgi:hypothetical protein
MKDEVALIFTSLWATLPACGVAVIHMTGKGVGGGRIAGSAGAFFVVWTLLAAGVTAIVSVLLSVPNGGACVLFGRG